MVLMTSQDKLHRDMCLYIHHSGRYCGSMFCVTYLWLDLYVGSRSWWKEVRALFWLCCCLVEYDSLDNFLCQYVFQTFSS
jgi:hypothetical protein